jgi:uncharacterized membrane protein
VLAVAGTAHFVVPRQFAAIVPDALPARDALVYGSGAAELACAAGLLHPRTRRVAGWATAVLFVAVFPANLQMALDSGDRSATYQAGTWARLPLQVPLVLWAVRIARRAGRDRVGRSRSGRPRSGRSRSGGPWSDRQPSGLR